MYALRIALAAFALAGISSAAQAIVVNIDAQSNTTVTQTFGPGTYDFAVIGTAQGGKYDGWTYNTGNLVRDAFTVSFDSAVYSVDHDNGSTKFSNFTTSSAAQTAFAVGPYAIYQGVSDGNLLFKAPVLELTFAKPTTVSFNVPDAQLWDNTGGVSLNVTAAVPEPETYALMMAGLAAMGFIARRRRSAA